ncbi:hypothetical protein EVG20_g9385 [Dentipellis fragilis]|uniref:Uncharacterized protein n=1 Tax=Dentipellis fragilis TaxID=205917 RepID=A0A4Y9Y0Z8_9AGAM|nr:hypothetical protein EVG20_g9385 [Dentipellis fragilis]
MTLVQSRTSHGCGIDAAQPDTIPLRLSGISWSCRTDRLPSCQVDPPRVSRTARKSLNTYDPGCAGHYSIQRSMRGPGRRPVPYDTYTFRAAHDCVRDEDARRSAVGHFSPPGIQTAGAGYVGSTYTLALQDVDSPISTNPASQLSIRAPERTKWPDDPARPATHSKPQAAIHDPRALDQFRSLPKLVPAPHAHARHSEVLGHSLSKRSHRQTRRQTAATCHFRAIATLQHATIHRCLPPAPPAPPATCH